MADTHLTNVAAGYFDLRAEAYDSKVHRNFYQEISERLIEQMPPGIQPASILEIGAGTGFATSLLRERFPDAAITALEPSRSMAECGRKNAVDAEWVCRTLADFDGSGFDLVFASMSSHWLSTAERHKLAGLAVGGTAALAIPIAGGLRLDGNQALLKMVKHVSARRNWKRESRRLHETADFLMAYFSDVHFDRFGIQDRYRDAAAMAEALNVRGVLPALFGDQAQTALELLALSNNDDTIEFNWEIGLVVATQA